MKIVVDTWCWIELGKDTEYADLIKEYLMSENNIIAPTTILSEIVTKFIGNKRPVEELMLFLQEVKAYTNLYPIDDDLAEKAGILYHKLRARSKDIGIMDAYVYALAIRERARILTGNSDFKAFKRVIYLQ